MNISQHLRATSYFSIRKHSARGVQFVRACRCQPRPGHRHLVHGRSDLRPHRLRDEAVLDIRLLQLLSLLKWRRLLRLLGTQLPVREFVLCTRTQSRPWRGGEERSVDQNWSSDE